MSRIASTTLPDVIAAILTDMDEVETFTQGEASVTLARKGAVQVFLSPTTGEAQWHEHDTEEEARECFAANVAASREVEEFLNNGGNPMVLAAARQLNISMEEAAKLVEQVQGNHMAQAMGAPAPAIGRAQVPPQSTVYVSGSVSEPHTGMYL